MAKKNEALEGHGSEQINEVFMKLGLSDGTGPTVPQAQSATSPTPPAQPLHLTLSAHSIVDGSD
jgi:hypothetical protein